MDIKIDTYNLYYKKYLKYKKKYLMMKNILIGGILDAKLIFNNNGVLTLEQIAPNQYYHEFQLVDGICQLRAVNNFLEDNIYNQHNIIKYLLHIYDNFESICKIINYIYDILRIEFVNDDNPYYSFYSNIIMLKEYIDGLCESYKELQQTDKSREEKVKIMFSNEDSHGIYNITSGIETIELLTSEIMFLLLFKNIGDKIYFTPVGSLNSIDELSKPISIFEIHKLLEIKFINKFHIGDTLRNHSYVYHLHENNTIIKIDSLISKFTQFDTTIDKIQPIVLNKFISNRIYTFYINDPIEITLVDNLYLNNIYKNYFKKLKKIVEIKMEEDYFMDNEEYDFDYESGSESDSHNNTPMESDD